VARVHAAGHTAKLSGDDRPLVGLHDLRHSFVALALASGLTLPEASALARHANPRITAQAHAGLSYDGRAKLGQRLAAKHLNREPSAGSSTSGECSASCSVGRASIGGWWLATESRSWSAVAAAHTAATRRARGSAPAASWQHWQRSSFGRVRSRSDPSARIPANREFQRTRAGGANACGHLPCRGSRVRVPSSAR